MKIISAKRILAFDWSMDVHGHRDAKASGARSVATEDAMPLADGGVVCNCDKP